MDLSTVDIDGLLDNVIEDLKEEYKPTLEDRAYLAKEMQRYLKMVIDDPEGAEWELRHIEITLKLAFSRERVKAVRVARKILRQVVETMGQLALAAAKVAL